MNGTRLTGYNKEQLIELKRIYEYKDESSSQEIEKIKIGDYIVKDKFSGYEVFPKEIFKELYELTNL